MILELSLVVFAITLTVTKSKILGSKREFVQQRYESAQLGGQPSYVHWWWHAMWHCPMCVGFWTSVIVCAFYDCPFGYIGTVLVVYGLNWLWHCVEDALFQLGQILKTDGEVF